MLPSAHEYEMEAIRSTTEDMHDLPKVDKMENRQERRSDEVSLSNTLAGQHLPETDEGMTSTSPPGSPAHEPKSPSLHSTCVIKRIWDEHVSVVVDFESCRDHLGTQCKHLLAHPLRTASIRVEYRPQ